MSQSTLLFTSDPEEVYDSDKEENENEPCDKSQASANDFAVLTECTEDVEVDRLIHAYQVKDETETLDQTCIILKKGLNPSIKIPEEPENYEPPVPKFDQGEIEFKKVDNPGGWSNYLFWPKFSKKQYQYHTLPLGARPVPIDAAGKQSINGWDFNYHEWKHTGKEKFRSGAKTENLFPNS